MKFNRFFIAIFLILSFGCKSVKKDNSTYKENNETFSVNVDTSKLITDLYTFENFKEFEFTVNTYEKFDSSGIEVFKPVIYTKKLSELSKVEDKKTEDINGESTIQGEIKTVEKEDTKITRTVSAKFIITFIIIIIIIFFIVKYAINKKLFFI